MGLTQAVEELRAVRAAKLVEHLEAHLVLLGHVAARLDNRLRAYIGREDDDRVPEVDGASLAVGDAPIVEDLKQ